MTRPRRPRVPARFRARYALATNVLLTGPFQGSPANEGEQVALHRPGPPQGGADPFVGFVPDLLVEEVNYEPSAPWAAEADGTGRSLQRLASGTFGVRDEDLIHATARFYRLVAP